MTTAMLAQKVNEKPIIFGAESVRAILEGQKSQTRRVLKPQPPKPGEYKYAKGEYKALHRRGDYWWVVPTDVSDFDPSPYELYEYHCPYGKPKDRLWVREAWAASVAYDSYKPQVLTPACGRPYYFDTPNPYDERGRWRSPIHMPRWASRLILEVTDVRVQPLREMDGEHDAFREGAGYFYEQDYIKQHGHYPVGIVDGVCMLSKFRKGWDALNAKRGFSFESNPFVWVIEFKHIAAPPPRPEGGTAE